MTEETKRIETEEEIKSYLQNLKYALSNNAEIIFQISRESDRLRNYEYSNKYTIGELFPNDDPVVILKEELEKLDVKDYIETVKDIRFPKREEMRVFAKGYEGFKDVYIKIRVELVNKYSFGSHTIFVMSFHFAKYKLKKEDFPYWK